MLMHVVRPRQRDRVAERVVDVRRDQAADQRVAVRVVLDGVAGLEAVVVDVERVVPRVDALDRVVGRVGARERLGVREHLDAAAGVHLRAGEGRADGRVDRRERLRAADADQAAGDAVRVRVALRERRRVDGDVARRDDELAAARVERRGHARGDVRLGVVLGLAVEAAGHRLRRRGRDARAGRRDRDVRRARAARRVVDAAVVVRGDRAVRRRPRVGGADAGEDAARAAVRGGVGACRRGGAQREVAGGVRDGAGRRPTSRPSGS